MLVLKSFLCTNILFWKELGSKIIIQKFFCFPKGKLKRFCCYLFYGKIPLKIYRFYTFYCQILQILFHCHVWKLYNFLWIKIEKIKSPIFHNHIRAIGVTIFWINKMTHWLFYTLFSFLPKKRGKEKRNIN